LSSGKLKLFGKNYPELESKIKLVKIYMSKLPIINFSNLNSNLQNLHPQIFVGF